MTADGEQIHVQAGRPQGELARRLHRVAVDQGPGSPAADGGDDFLQGKAGSGFIVDQHDTDEHRVLSAGPGHLRGGHDTGGAGKQAGDLKALLFQLIKGGGDGGMLHGGRDRVIPCPPPRRRAAEDGEIIGLCPPRGEKHCFGGHAQQGSHRPPRSVQLPLGFEAGGVQGGGIAVAGGHHIKGLVRRLPANGGGGAVVQICSAVHGVALSSHGSIAVYAYTSLHSQNG